MRLFPTPRYKDEPEFLDELTGVSPHDLEMSLRDIRRANIFGLGTWVVLHHLDRLLASRPGLRSLHVLDIATGSGDIPEELFRWGRRRGLAVTVTLSDVSPAILGVARQRIDDAGFGDRASRASYVVCDAGRVPFADAAFDVCICSLALHHLDLKLAIRAMQSMSRLSRVGFIINDVYRARGAWLMAQGLAHITTGNRLTRHDGPASVLRAFTPRELRRMAEQAGVPVEISAHPFWRVAVVGRRNE